MTEQYGKFESNDHEYDRLWNFVQRFGDVPPDVDYDEVPRGRVEYDIIGKKSCVYVDPCILNDRKALDEIEREFHLPSANTKEPERDPRYKCKKCGDYQQSDN